MSKLSDLPKNNKLPQIHHWVDHHVGGSRRRGRLASARYFAVWLTIANDLDRVRTRRTR